MKSLKKKNKPYGAGPIPFSGVARLADFPHD